ncbi:MAG TPA: DUF6314 family protein [Mycobacteriales bacterium]|nr:DUF6314 family protein [Mycobacteriales bacterium]
MNGPHFWLAGTWSLDRRVQDRSTGASGCVHGELVISRAGDELSWDESGQLTWAGRTAPVSRSLRLRPDAGQWWMFFADGRPFHPWRPGLEVVHECRPDTYRGTVTVHPDGRRMRTVWSVTGPNKDQLLVTRLRRRPG